MLGFQLQRTNFKNDIRRGSRWMRRANALLSSKYAATHSI